MEKETYLSIELKNDNYNSAVSLKSWISKRAVLSNDFSEEGISTYSPEGTKLTFDWIDGQPEKLIVKFDGVILCTESLVDSSGKFAEILNYYTKLSNNELTGLATTTKHSKEQLKTTYLTIDISLNTEIFDSVEDFKNRNDILFAFEKEHLRSTTKNIFFRYFQLDAEHKRLNKIDFEIYDLPIQLYTNEDKWLPDAYGFNDKRLKFTITDKLNNVSEERFFSTEDWMAFEELIDHMKNLHRLGTHQAIKEINILKAELNKMKRRYEKA